MLREAVLNTYDEQWLMWGEISIGWGRYPTLGCCKRVRAGIFWGEEAEAAIFCGLWDADLEDGGDVPRHVPSITEPELSSAW